MSTDLYGVRVLGVAPRERRVRLRVFVVYYDPQYKNHQPLPDDASFFFRYFCSTSDRRFKKGGPLGDVVTLDQWLDEPFVDEHAWRFVERVERIATRNFPVEDWSQYHDFYYERGGRWTDEDKLVQADYDVWVTDARWIEQLTLGDSEGTTCYPTRADRVRADDAARIPDLRRPIVTIEPFPNQIGEKGTPGRLAYSDDGRFLAVASDACELVIYDVAANYREHARTPTPTGLDLFAELGWIASTHVVVQAQNTVRAAFDVDACAVVPPSGARVGRAWSRNHRVLDHGGDNTIVLDNDRPPLDAGFIVEAIAFTRDESRMYIAGMGTSILAIDPVTSTIVRTYENVSERIFALATNRDGSYILFTEGGAGYGIVRAEDGETIVSFTMPNARYSSQLAWSPDQTQVALLVITGEDGYFGELRVCPVGLPPLPKHERPDREPPEEDEAKPSAIEHALVHRLARSSEPLDADAWSALLAAHGRWLDTGGGGGDGDELPDSYLYETLWTVLEAAGLVLAVWSGPAGSDGAQAVLRMRRLDNIPKGARLAWADLSGVVGANTDLAGADLRGVSATDADLSSANFRGADLRRADFSRSNLRGADFTNANLEACDFERADLTGAIFTGARIGGIKLARAELAEICDFGT